jgi:putative transcriptional regulator
MRRALDLSNWVPGPMPGIDLFHFEDAVGADVGLVRFTPGLTFPMHEHGGEETMIVLEGGYTDLVTGVHYGPGDVQRSGPSTRHALRADADAPLCFAIVLTADIRIILD